MLSVRIVIAANLVNRGVEFVAGFEYQSFASVLFVLFYRWFIKNVKSYC